ncbi:MAG: DUF4391 domain-containing protein [Gemmatimonadota bacterium]
MNSDTLLAALDLPTASRVDQRVPKKLLLENGARTAANKRQITDGIEELFWAATLKPTTIGVREYRDDARQYLEIAVLCLTLRAGANARRLTELVHRAIPYPVLLLTAQGDHAGMSAMHKRWSQGEAGKTVLDGDVITVDWDDERDAGFRVAFCEALALGRQPRDSLYALYQGWLDTLLALHAARVTHTFMGATNAEQASARSDALHECSRLHTEIARLRTEAARERQMSRQITLNLEIKRAEARLAATMNKL